MAHITDTKKLADIHPPLRIFVLRREIHQPIPKKDDVNKQVRTPVDILKKSKAGS